MEKPGGYKTMTIDEIVTLIQAVSDNGLTSFEYEEGDQKLVLKKKKKKADKPNYDHVVQVGESMHSIAQMYGIQIKSLYKMNKKDKDYIPEEGDVLKLR